MKKSITAFVALVASSVAMAQENPLLQNLSLEAAYGYNQAMGTKAGLKAADVSGARTIHLGATYHINNTWGVRGSLGSAKFETDQAGAKQGVTMYKAMLEATYNVWQNISPAESMLQPSPFALTAHAGAGLGMGKKIGKGKDDMMAHLQVGLMPTYQWHKNWAVFLDATYTSNLSQSYNFDGKGVKGESTFTAGTATVVLGVQVKLGK